MSRQNITKALAEVRPSEYLDYKLYLEHLYLWMKKNNTSYSYKEFAADLGFKATTIMHQIVRGYRPLTVKTAERICQKISPIKNEKQYLLALVSYNNSKNAITKQQYFEKMLRLKSSTLANDLDKDTLEYFSSWYHPVIWELAGTSGFSSDPHRIASRLQPTISVDRITESLNLLVRLGLLAFNEDQTCLYQTQKRISTGHKVKNLAIMNYHLSMIDHGKEALRSIPGSKRDISAITVTADEETFKKIKTMIHTFQLQILEEAEKNSSGESQDQVYQMNIQLFPFTK